MKPSDKQDTIITKLGLKETKLSEDQRKLIDELSEANEKLMEAERLKSNFLSNIRNEINNPITSILELSKRLSEDQLDENMVRKYGSLIFSEAFNLDFHLRNIISVAEVESGELSLSPALINLSTLIFNTLNSFEHLVAKKKLKLVVNNSVSETFCTDSAKLELIIRNLLANAIEFSKEGSSVEVHCKKEAGMLYLNISDDGVGISNDAIKSIFDRFKQLDNGSTKVYRGQGLGLSLVLALLETMGGGLEIESAENKGTIFSIRIPETMDHDAVSESGNDFLFDTENEMVF